MNWKENIGKIKEIYPGQFRIVLNFATNEFLRLILNDNYKYVCVSKHNLKKGIEWDNYSLPLSDKEENLTILARQIEFDFAMPTTEFRQILSELKPGIHLVQLNKLPNYYFNLTAIKGKTRYDLLKQECDYLFEFDIPSATDYGTLTSSDKQWLQSLLDNENIDWQNLP